MGSGWIRSARIRELLARIDDEKSRVEAECERAFALRLGGGCSLPAGAHAELSGESLSVVGMVATQDGKHLVKGTLNGGPKSARALGRRLAVELLRNGGREILRSVAQ